MYIQNKTAVTEDEKIESYHQGYLAHKQGLNCPEDLFQREGWQAREKAMLIEVFLPPRPEGYFHTNLETTR